MTPDPLVRVAPGVFIRQRFLPAYREAERRGAGVILALAASLAVTERERESSP